jgi:hypothetical protein
MSLFLGLLFSSVGVLFLVIGKRTYSTLYIVCGALLIVVSYVIDNVVALAILGVAISAVPFVVSRGWV